MTREDGIQAVRTSDLEHEVESLRTLRSLWLHRKLQAKRAPTSVESTVMAREFVRKLETRIASITREITERDERQKELEFIAERALSTEDRNLWEALSVEWPGDPS